MTTTQEKKVYVDVTIKMRLGESSDFKIEKTSINDNGQLVSEPFPNIGQSYWLRSEITGEFDNRNYQVKEDWSKEDWDEFRDYLRRGMVYVAAGYFELKDAGEI